MEKKFKYQGLAKRLQIIFDYHRDAILREINAECNSLSFAQKEAIYELFSYIIDDTMLWPDNVVNLLNNAHKPETGEQTKMQKEWQELFID